jgi:hypothetical protein
MRTPTTPPVIGSEPQEHIWSLDLRPDGLGYRCVACGATLPTGNAAGRDRAIGEAWDRFEAGEDECPVRLPGEPFRDVMGEFHP